MSRGLAFFLVRLSSVAYRTSCALTHAFSWLAGLGKLCHDHIRTVGAGGQQHAFTDAKAHLMRLQVCYYDDLLANQFRQTVRLPNTGKDGTLLVADVDAQTQQLIRSLDDFRLQHGGDTEIDLGKLVDADLRCQCLY